jgi:D-alanyl-lipoteichoic acid acyltransferase DltB (MBOAT superfamily)
VYRKKIPASRDFVSFATYVTFFPQLVAGPIERASAFLPQFAKKREFDLGNSVDGLKQMLWGFFKKMVIADNCAEYANLIFNNSEDYSGFALFLGAVFFSIQIYGDFSGYSDIAIGTARLFGFNLMQNFAFPYFSRDIAEFWRRWHISLSTWFRDYVYIPLGGSKGGVLIKIRNTFIVFILSGFWHGANWTFIIWGGLNALYFLPLLLTKSNRNNLDVVAIGRNLPSLKEVLFMGTTFFITTIAWVFFRSENVSSAGIFISEMLRGIITKEGYVQALNLIYWQIGYALPIILLCFFLLEWFGRTSKYGIQHLGKGWHPFLRQLFYILMVLSIVFFANDNTQKFIYFNF